MKTVLFSFICLFTMNLNANTYVKIKPLGESRKGQFVVVEEYGDYYGVNKHFLKIKVYNAWKKKNVEEHKILLSKNIDIDEMRNRLNIDFKKLFSKYSIRSFSEI